MAYDDIPKMVFSAARMKKPIAEKVSRIRPTSGAEGHVRRLNGVRRCGGRVSPDPTKKATRNGAAFISVVASPFVAFRRCAWRRSFSRSAKSTFAGIIVSVIVGLTVHLRYMCVLTERVVVMRPGRFDRLAGPGLFFTIPLFEFCTLRVDQRMNATPFGAEEALTSDLVPPDRTPLFWVIWDPEKACTEVHCATTSPALSAQTALRDAIGRASLQNAVMRRHQLDQSFGEAVEQKVSDWGIPSCRSRFATSSSPRNFRMRSRLKRRPNAARARITLMEARRTSPRSDDVANRTATTTSF